MTVYLLIYAFYLSLATGYFITRSKVFVWLSLIFLILVASLGSGSGTDTWVYNNYYDDIRQNGCGANELEPLFCFYSSLLSGIFNSNEWIRFTNATLIGAMLLLPYRRSYYRQILVMFLLVPTVYLDFAMNGVRAGLAYSLVFALAACDHYSKANWIFRALTYVASSGVHLSSAILVYLTRLSKGRRTLIGLITLTALASVVGYLVATTLQFEFLARLASSLDSEPFSQFSGYLPTLINLAVIYLMHEGKAASRRTLVIFVLLNILSLVLARFTYNGIRVLQLLFFAQLILLSSHIRVRPKSLQYFVIFAILLLTISSKLRNWENEADMAATPTPFIPYSVQWQIR